MKRLLLLALCALLSANADARTLYVDASRPNNSGNGLSKAKAKKTIQAAINASKKGDTILVLPGSYAPIKTNNKKIEIKSVKGRKKTKLVLGKTDAMVADLSKYVKKHNSEYNYDYMEATGNATVLSGFLLDGMKRGSERDFAGFTAVQGGTLKSCTARNFYTEGGFLKSKLENCLVQNNYLVTDALFDGCTVKSTKITKNKDDGNPGCAGGIADGSTLVNCLIAGNEFERNAFEYSTLVNCTIADNTMSSGWVFSYSSKFFNCILRNNRSQGTWTTWDEETGTNVTQTFPLHIHNVDDGNVYKNTDKTNRNPKFTSAYKLKKGSYCINSGKLTKAQKKLVGTKDLAGKKRIRGKAIDRGCYEY